MTDEADMMATDKPAAGVASGDLDTAGEPSGRGPVGETSASTPAAVSIGGSGPTSAAGDDRMESGKAGFEPDAARSPAVSPAGLEAAEAAIRRAILATGATAAFLPATDALDSLLAVVASERERANRAEHIIECADTPLMRDVLAERDAERERADEHGERLVEALQTREDLRVVAVRLREALQEIADADGYTERASWLIGVARAALVPVAAPPEEPA